MVERPEDTAGANIKTRRLNPVQTRVLATTVKSVKQRIRSQEQNVEQYRQAYETQVKNLNALTKELEDLVEGIEFDLMLQDV